MAFLSVGVSPPGTCGVRDYATTLAARLPGEVRDVWLVRPPRVGWPAGWRSDRALLRAALRAARPGDAAVVHYSPFELGAHGLPFAGVLLGLRLRRRGVRVATVLHELVYPWGRGGARGLLWAVWQRAVLPLVLRGCDLVVVTTPDRYRAVTTRWRVPPRRVLLRPVWATIPAGDAEPEPGRVGTLSWTNETTAVEVAREALARLGIRPVLLGSPGPGTPEAARWGDAELSGVLPAEEMAREIARLDVYLHADTEGPTPRRTSLASALAAGRCVVAFDGPLTWEPLRSAVALAPPTADGLAEVLGGLLRDDARRRALGAAARDAYRRLMAPEETARLIVERLCDSSS